jgi:hypothetical protein
MQILSKDKPSTQAQRTCAESQWRRAQATDAAARQAAWRATRQLMRTRAAWVEQGAELGVWLLQMIVLYLGYALFVAVIGSLAFETLPPPAEAVLVAQLLAFLATALWLPLRGIREFGSPFIRAWNRAYSEARRERWSNPSE